MLGDLARNGAPAPAGRASVDPQVISDHDFLVTHGMTREQTAERGALWKRQAFEEDACADLDRDLESISATSDTARHK